MDRLTNKREADAQRKAYQTRLDQGYPRNIPEERFLRLAAYEDTGLTPKEVQVMRWIPVEERLPNPKQNVLAYSPKSGIAEADYADGFWMQYRWSSVMDGVTHWMPLPAAPKEASHD